MQNCCVVHLEKYPATFALYGELGARGLLFLFYFIFHTYVGLSIKTYQMCQSPQMS